MEFLTTSYNVLMLLLRPNLSKKILPNQRGL